MSKLSRSLRVLRRKNAPGIGSSAQQSKSTSGYNDSDSSSPMPVPLKKTRTEDNHSSSLDKDDGSSSQDAMVNSQGLDASSTPLTRSFFDVPCVNLAQKLLGQRLVRMQGSKRLCGKIVETEAYLGSEDKASHSYQGKRTPRNEAMYMQPGTVYVYNIYGMYCCLNISSKADGAAVLIRALETVDGQEIMRPLRQLKNSSKVLKEKDLCNGPSKLCQALNISKNEFNKTDLTSSDVIWLEEGDVIQPSSVVCSARINIDNAEDWKDKPLRYYILGNKSVSVRNKKAEGELAS